METTAGAGRMGTWTVTIALALAHASVSLGDEPLYSFAVFSDNKTGFPKLTRVLTMFRQDVRARFVIGLGDHVNGKGAMKPWEQSLAGAYGSAEAFYKIFYPVIGDNEDRHFSPVSKQTPDEALQAGWYERLLLAKRDGTILRPTIKAYEKAHGDYYAAIEHGGVRVHLVSLYFQDNMKGFMAPSLAFGTEWCGRIKREHPSDPLIVIAHQDRWWYRQRLAPDHPIFQADILMEASSHAFRVRDRAPGDALVFNTSSTLRGPGHVFEVKVFKDRLVLLALGHDGYRLGPYELEDWRKVWIKPFGGKRRPAATWAEVEALAGRATPRTETGVNPQRVLFEARTRERAGVPTVEQFEKDLAGQDARVRAVALLSLGYLSDGARAGALIETHLRAQPDPRLRAHAVLALLRKHPASALPLLRGVLSGGQENLLGREEFAKIARQKGPERVRILGALMHSPNDRAAFLAADAVARVGADAEVVLDELIRALQTKRKGRYWVYMWMYSARALGNIGPRARSAGPALVSRLNATNRFALEDVLRALAKIGGPDAKAAVPRIRELTEHKSPIVRKAATKALEALQ